LREIYVVPEEKKRTAWWQGIVKETYADYTHCF